METKTMTVPLVGSAGYNAQAVAEEIITHVQGEEKRSAEQANATGLMISPADRKTALVQDVADKISAAIAASTPGHRAGNPAAAPARNKTSYDPVVSGPTPTASKV